MEQSTRKNLVSALITGLILLVGIFGFLKLKSMKESTVSDNVVIKERRTVEYKLFTATTEANKIELDGRLEAHEKVNITSKVQGVMQGGNSSVKEGKYYKKGDILFSIDGKEADFNLKAQRALLMTSITQMMPDLKFDYPQSFSNWEVYLNQFDVNKSITKLPEPISQKEKYFLAGKNIYNQYYTIKSQETRLSEYTIYAPFSGVITSVNVFPGALINPTQVLATMINTSQYEIAAPIPLDNLKYIKVGQKVNLYSSEMDQEWTGSVSRIGTQIDPNTQNLPIYISVNGSGLKDGMYLKGTLNGQDLSNVTKLPKTIFLSPTSIFVIQDSTLVTRTVTSLKRSADYVLVNDLKADEKVVIGSLAGLFEGQKVNY